MVLRLLVGFFVVLLFSYAGRRKIILKVILGSKSCHRARKGLKAACLYLREGKRRLLCQAAPACTQSPIEQGQDGAGGVCRAVVTPQAPSFHCKNPASPVGSSHRVHRLCQPTAPCLFLFLKTTRHTGKINTKSPQYVRTLSCKSCCSSLRILKTYGFFYHANLAVLHLQSIFYSTIFLKHRCTC